MVTKTIKKEMDFRHRKPDLQSFTGRFIFLGERGIV
jgi:hypothetical protein